MPRPPKPMAITNAAYTKEDKATRIAIEDTISNEDLTKTPPKDMPATRKIIYRWLYKALEPSGVLSTLDKYTFIQACIIIDRLRELDNIIDTEGVAVKELRIARSDYYKQYLSICSELCLSPAARAKMGSLLANKAKDNEDPLLAAIGGSSD